MINIGIFYRLIPQTWQIVLVEVIDGVAEDKISVITQSTSEDIIYKSETSRLRKATQMIKVGSCHRLMPQTWWIFTTEGLGPSRSIFCILQKPNIPNSSSHYL